MNFLKKIFGGQSPEKDEAPKITVEKIQHIFEYGKLKNMTGTSHENLRDLKVGHMMSWKSKTYNYSGYHDIPAQTVPPHIQWSDNPVFAYVSVTDQQVQYHWSENGGSAVFICPVTTNPEHIRFIDRIFEQYYSDIFRLPHSLKEIRITKEKEDKTDRMLFIEKYLVSKDSDFFYDNFYDNDIDAIAMWVDWREEDENIVTYCEDILQTHVLSVKTVNADHERGFETIISYKDQETFIRYRGIGADRDTTLITLNQVLHPEFEIRLCKESLGNDTLCFLPLLQEQWHFFETRYPEQVREKFEIITSNSKMFN